MLSGSTRVVLDNAAAEGVAGNRAFASRNRDRTRPGNSTALDKVLLDNHEVGTERCTLPVPVFCKVIDQKHQKSRFLRFPENIRLFRS